MADLSSATGAPATEALGVAQDYAQEWGLGYIPSALAVAVADDVNIWTKGNITAGDTGIVALSVAKADATATDNTETLGSAAVAVSGDVNVRSVAT